MDHTRLDGGGRELGVDGVGQARQPVADEDEDVDHAPVAQLREHRQPERRRFPQAGGAGPDPQHVTAAVQIDPDRDVERPVGRPDRL
jgi:hypothetical protein